MSLLNNVALTRETKAFVKVQTAFDTLAFPAATDAIAVLGVPQVGQKDKFADSREIVESRSKPARTYIGTEAGQWSIQVYARPSGSLGTPPVEGALMKCALGKETINAGVSVVYEPAMTLPIFSLCYREGHTVHFCVGCKVASWKPTLTKADLLALEFSGQCQKVLHAGTEETVAGSTTTVLNLAAGGAMLFSAGARVQVDAATNASAGYEITDTDVDADTITITPALASAPAAGVTVKGYLPIPSLAGHTVAGCTGTLTLAGASLTITGFEATLTNALSPDEEEITEAGYISGIDEGARAAQGTIKARFRRQYAAWFERARREVQGAVVMQAGPSAGKRIKLELPQAVMDTPSLSGDEMRRNIDVALVGLPTSALEDEIKVTYL